jgi:ABC-type bacteriocin/lantibiotic exporter with double-glycine peptidase domain
VIIICVEPKVLPGTFRHRLGTTMKKIQKHIDEFNLINTQRKAWLILSAFVSVGVLGVILGWNFVQGSHLVWIVVCGGLLVSMIWWYWTMSIIRHLIHYKKTEAEILIDITKEIRNIKNTIVKDIQRSSKD